MNNVDVISWQFLFGLVSTLVFAKLISMLLAVMIKKHGKFTPPSPISQEDWNNAFAIPEERRTPNIYIGYLEATFCYICIYTNQPILIGGWLTFKLASKWQTWNAIMKIPETMDGVNLIQYIGAKNHIAWFTLQRWLLGTLANILAGFFGFVLAGLIIKMIYPTS